MTGDKPKTNLKHIVEHYALEAKYNEIKKNRQPEDTMESKLGRRGVDKMMEKMRKSDKLSYMTPTAPQENHKPLSTPKSPTSVAHDGFEK